MQMSLTLINSRASEITVALCDIEVRLAPGEQRKQMVGMPEGPWLPVRLHAGGSSAELQIRRGSRAGHEADYPVANFANIYQHVELGNGGSPVAMTLNIGTAFSSKHWMGQLDLDEDATLAALTLPGSHDTATWKGSRASKCQTFDIRNQLNHGIRWFDLRLAVDGSDLKVWHGSEEQGLCLAKDLLPAITGFLAAHPTEIVIVSVVNVSWDWDKKDFDGLLHKILMAGVPAGRLYDRNAVPRIADVRGCVVLMRQDEDATYGILADHWPDDGKGVVWNDTGNIRYSVQNCYKFGPDYLAAKWALVKHQLDCAKTAADGECWYVNYTSASRAPITDPVDIALAPEQQGINYRLHAYLCAQAVPSYFGLVPMDFPEQPAGLIKLLISMNKLKH